LTSGGHENMSNIKRILYVEDEPDIQEVARLSLEIVGGFELKICSSGEEAIECAVKFAPDLILLDVMMPGIDGLSTLKILKTLPELSLVPAIFMTAKVQVNELEEYKALGSLGVIIKPFDPMSLPEQIEEIWQKKHL